MKVILIGNYEKDDQESMLRFARMLHTGFSSFGVNSEIWNPKIYLGKGLKSTATGFRKWIGYIDKWILFPFILRRRLRDKNHNNSNIRFHICDHSNSPYLKYLPKERTGITCHDVLAIRGALGFEDAHCPASFFGKFLQKWILTNLRQAKLLATVSRLTLKQLQEITSDKERATSRWRVIHNAFNADFTPMGFEQRSKLLIETGIDPSVPFVLHVGSAHGRKNRKMLLDMVHFLGNQWTGSICFAGEPVDEELRNSAAALNLQDRIISIVRPDHNTLVALYSSCEAFIFPSFSEGFGWPVIEAQACGAPVIASNIEPMPEVSGGAAIHVNPNKPDQFAKALLLIRDEAKRDDLIRRGFENTVNFKPATMIKSYLQLHAIEVELI